MPKVKHAYRSVAQVKVDWMQPVRSREVESTQRSAKAPNNLISAEVE